VSADKKEALNLLASRKARWPEGGLSGVITSGHTLARQEGQGGQSKVSW
jgi:hypothetical protein